MNKILNFICKIYNIFMDILFKIIKVVILLFVGLFIFGFIAIFLNLIGN